MKRIFDIILITGILGSICGQLSGQSNQDGSMPQYLFTEFSKSTVRMKNGQIQTLVMNYNMVTEMMVFLRDGNYYDLVNPELVDTVFLCNSRFIPAGKVFYEVLVSGPVSLFIQHRGNLLPAGKPAAYGGTSQVSASTSLSSITLSSGLYNLKLPSDFIVSTSPLYWIKRDNEMYSFETEKQFLKLFPSEKEQIKAFMNEHHLKFNRTENLAMIVRYLSTLK